MHQDFQLQCPPVHYSLEENPVIQMRTFGLDGSLSSPITQRDVTQLVFASKHAELSSGRHGKLKLLKLERKLASNQKQVTVELPC